MGYYAKVILDSVNPVGKRLTTFEIGLPKFLQAELNTHRMLSRNSASSRAIPFSKFVVRVRKDPVIPVWWGKNQPGMQAREEIDEAQKETALSTWLSARDSAMDWACVLAKTGVHKQIVNRILEPWLFTVIIVSATEWENFFSQRLDKGAQPEFRHVATMMADAYEQSVPRPLAAGQWHAPYLMDDPELEGPFLQENLLRISVARCARVSYLTHDERRDPEADLDLYNRLLASGHWSPFEHVAAALPNAAPSGNFAGWIQYRKTFAHESRPKPRPGA